MKPLHIVFNRSAALTLRGALAMAGRDEAVVGFPDCLEYGPINSDFAARVTWCDEVLDCSDWEDMAADLGGFWDLALDSSRERMVWFTPRSAPCYCNYLEWLRRNGDAPAKIIDLTDVWTGDEASNRRRHVHPPGVMSEEEFLKYRLWDMAQLLEADRRTRDLALWEQLRQENAPLRALEDGRLISVPIGYFDAQILSHIGDDWIRGALVAGYFWGEMFGERMELVIQTGDLLPFARLRDLIEAGILKKRGDIWDNRAFEVRRA